MTINSENLKQMREIQENFGIRAVLIHLNGLTDHRFTALYRFDEDSLHNLFFFDRQQPEIVSCPEIPVMASYCVFVRRSGQTFVTPDSLADERVLGHARRMEVRSYCGVPLVDDEGRMFGTICHFDYHPLLISDDSIAL